MRIYNEEKLKEYGENGKLTVAVFSDVYYPVIGGVSTVIRNMAKDMLDECNIIVFCQDHFTNYQDCDNFPIVRCKTIKFLSSVGDVVVPKFDFKLKKLFKKLKIDIIHIHTFFGLAKLALKLSKKYNIPVVYHGHTKLYDEYLSITKNKIISKILTKRAVKKLNKAVEIWTVSNGTKRIYEGFGVRTPGLVVRNTTEFRFLDNKEFVNKIKSEYKIQDKNVLLFLSRMEIKTKNIDFLLNSLKQLKDNGTEFQLLMVGDGSDLEEIKKMASELELNNVIFTGNVKDLKTREAIYQLADLFVFPSVTDTAGLVVYEAASQNTPSICIADTFTAEVIENGQNGFTCSLNEMEFANKITEVLSNKETLEQVGKNANKTLVNKNGFKDCVELYRNLINKKK